jgi:hypothetical protein
MGRRRSHTASPIGGLERLEFSDQDTIHLGYDPVVPTFNVRRAEIGLFDVDDDAKLREAFSTLTATQPVLIDDAALNIVADDLGLDAEGIALDAQRYVGGQYRQKAMGFSGGRLGDFGEILTYLLWRMDGKSIERVVDGVRPQDVPANARFTFPEPDYIVRTPTGAPGVLEVKSRELLKFQPLLQLHSRPAGQRGHRWLQPCDRVAECANEALSQLGSTVAPGHGLELRSGKRIPFPANYGVAVAVLMHDGRLAGLIGNGKRFKTPPPCRESVPARDCWACAGDGTVAADAVVVEMANRPDHLPLVPALEGDAGWFAAYPRLAPGALGWIAVARFPEGSNSCGTHASVARVRRRPRGNPARPSRLLGTGPYARPRIAAASS